MSEISAVYIIQYIETNFYKIVEKHKKLYNIFSEQIKGLPLKLFPSFHSNDNILPACFCILFDKWNDKIEIELKNNNIFCRKYYKPLDDSYNANLIYQSILCLPCNLEINSVIIDKIINIFKKYS